MNEKKRTSAPRIYRKHRPWRVIVTLLILLAILALAGCVALFIYCGQNLVYTTRGVRVVIPWLDNWLGRT